VTGLGFKSRFGPISFNHSLFLHFTFSSLMSGDGFGERRVVGIVVFLNLIAPLVLVRGFPTS
jgi:hypothetical protein